MKRNMRHDEIKRNRDAKGNTLKLGATAALGVAGAMFVATNPTIKRILYPIFGGGNDTVIEDVQPDNYPASGLMDTVSHLNEMDTWLATDYKKPEDTFQELMDPDDMRDMLFRAQLDGDDIDQALATKLLPRFESGQAYVDWHEANAIEYSRFLGSQLERGEQTYTGSITPNAVGSADMIIWHTQQAREEWNEHNEGDMPKEQADRLYRMEQYAQSSLLSAQKLCVADNAYRSGSDISH